MLEGRRSEMEERGRKVAKRSRKAFIYTG